VNKVASMIALAACAGCAGFGFGPAKPAYKLPEVAAYYPLAVGNSWTYSANVLGERTEQKISIVRQDFGFFVDDQKGRLKVDAYGLRDDRRYLLREPLEEGRSWTSVVSAQSVEHSRIVEVDKPCTVPAGAFLHCLTVENRNRQDEHHTMVMRMTFAPEVGIVRVQTTLDNDGKLVPQSELELVSFQVRPKPVAGNGP